MPVAQRRGLLELEPLGRRAHLLLERADGLSERARRHLGDLEQAPGAGVVVVQVRHLDQRVVDLLEDRARLDAVLLVVGGLLDAAPLGLGQGAPDRVGDLVGVEQDLPLRWRAARPAVWISDVSLRRKPSLSASSTATSDTSGRSSPSRSRLIPTRMSNSPLRSAVVICTRSSVSMSLCR